MWVFTFVKTLAIVAVRTSNAPTNGVHVERETLYAFLARNAAQAVCCKIAGSPQKAFLLRLLY